MVEYSDGHREPGRLVRVRFPSALLRQIEDLLEAGVGGYTDRSELVVDAVRERLLELGETHIPPVVSATNWIVEDSDRDDDPGTVRRKSLGDPATHTLHLDFPIPDWNPPLINPPSPPPPSPTWLPKEEWTTWLPKEGWTAPPLPIVFDGVLTPIEGRDDISQVGPLFGLHNRDFPSLWALGKLAELTTEGPIPYSEFMTEVAGSAWRYGQMLGALEQRGHKGLTGLFPTNPDKREASEARFLNFGVGEAKLTEGGWTTRGPLFQWGVAGIVVSEGVGSIGVTSLGAQLIGEVVGLTPDTPHPRQIAVGFAEFLRASAPDDWWGFQRLLTAVGAGASTRNEVARHFHGSRFGDNWTKNEVSTNAAGYVARAREWGFLEQKQQDGRYVLTDFGSEQLAQGEAPESATSLNDTPMTDPRRASNGNE